MQWFNFIDSDKDGLVSAPELQRALSKGGLHYSLQTIANMIRCASVKSCIIATLDCLVVSFATPMHTDFGRLEPTFAQQGV